MTAAELVDPKWVPNFVLAGSSTAVAAELHALMGANDIDEFQLAILETAGAAERIERTARIFS